jgi:hypothetical protein
VSPNSFSYLLTFGFLALFISGCGSDTSKPGSSASPSPSVSVAASPAPVASSAPFGQPVVTSADPNASPASDSAAKSETMAALLPASDSNTIVRNTLKGRSDPFANVVLQTVVETKTNSNGITAQPQRIASSSTFGKTTISSAPKVGSVGSVGSGLGLASAAASAGKAPVGVPAKTTIAVKPATNLDSDPPSSKPNKSKPNQNQPALVPAKPIETALRDLPKASPSVAPAPQPMVARNIQVSGVAQVNGQTQVILKLPNESFSRYVSVGERVMDGKVLVKRVENPNAITPVVVLEEVSIEVPRKVGDKPTVPAKADAR